MRLDDLLIQIVNIAEKFGVYSIINAPPGTYKKAFAEAIFRYIDIRRREKT